MQLVEAPDVRHHLAVQEALDQPDALLEPIEALAETRPEVQAERVVLSLEPATAEAEDEPTVRQVVERRGELGRQARIAERVGRDEQAEPRPADDLGQGGEAGPALELVVSPISLVGQQVIVQPDRVESGPFGEPSGGDQRRPIGPVDPERRPETHGRYRIGVASAPDATTIRRVRRRVLGWYATRGRPLA